MLTHVSWKGMIPYATVACGLLMLAVAPAAAGTVTLAWDAPTTNTDGSPLTNLAGFNVYYGTAPGVYSGPVDVGPVLQNQIVDLPDGNTYYFAVTAYDTYGNESGYSNEVSKTLPPTTQFSLAVTKTGSGYGAVSSSPVGISCGTVCTGTYASGTAVLLTAEPDQGSTFGGWSGSCSGSGPCTVTVDANSAVTAAFAVMNYTISAGAETGGTLSPAGAVSVDHGGSRSFSINPFPGYRIADVLVDGRSIGPVSTYTFSNTTENHSITASFAMKTYTIAASTSGTGGAILPSGPVTAAHGDTMSFSINPDPGYHVSDVVVDGVSVGATTTYTLSAIAANHTITAVFALNSYTITSSAGTGGSINPAGTLSVLHGGNGMFTISPDQGYRIANVHVDSRSVGAVESYTFTSIAADHTIAAEFVRATATLTLAKVGSGSGIVASSPAGISCGSLCTETFSVGTLVSLTASPDDTSVFSGWSGACSGSASCTITIDADKTVYSLFSPKPEFSLFCPDAGLPCVERPDGGSDGDNLVSSKPKSDVDYAFQAVVQDTGGSPVSVTLYLTQRAGPEPDDYIGYPMTCEGMFNSGAFCVYQTKLGPAAVHRYYVEAVMSDGGTILRYPRTTAFPGPQVSLMRGYNLVGAPRDMSTAALDGQGAFSSSRTYRWHPDLGYYTKVTDINPVKTGEGYFSYNKSGSLPELAGHADVKAPEFVYPLKTGWNFISNPYSGNVRLADITVQRDGEIPVSWQEAAASGWLTNALYAFTGSDWGGAFVPASDATAVLVPWIGYKIYLKRSDAPYSLVIPNPR